MTEQQRERFRLACLRYGDAAFTILRYHVVVQHQVEADDTDEGPGGWVHVSSYGSPCAASAAADADKDHAQAWDMSSEPPRLVHDNGKWPGGGT